MNREEWVNKGFVDEPVDKSIDLKAAINELKKELATLEKGKNTETKNTISDTEKTSKNTTTKTEPVKKLSFKEQKEYAEIEAIIAETEGKLKVVQLQMSQNASDYGKLNELTKEETALQEKLDYLMERWAYLEELAENSK